MDYSNAITGALAAGGYAYSTYRGVRNIKRKFALSVSTPISNSTVTNMKLQYLARQVARNTPATENFNNTVTLTVPATSVMGFDNTAISAALIANAEFAYKTLGDFYRNMYIKVRIGTLYKCSAIRVVLYWCRDPGTYLTSLPHQAAIDPLSVTVIYDRMIYPLTSTDNKDLNFRVPLNKMTAVNRSGASSGTIRKGELCIAVSCTNPAATADILTLNYQLFFKNK